VFRVCLTILPTILRLTLAFILSCICRMLKSVVLARRLICATTWSGVRGRPNCFPRALAAFIPAVTRSLISEMKQVSENNPLFSEELCRHMLKMEALKGDRSGQHSIRINQQWRVCFRWRAGDAYDVEIVDYH